MARRLAIGIWLLEKTGIFTHCPIRGHKVFIWTLTFLCYTGYYLTRKPFSVVKSVLCPYCSNRSQLNYSYAVNGSNTVTGWAPFNGTNGETLLGAMDYSLLFAYAVGTYVSGFIADKVNTRYFLTIGMLGCALSSILMGVAYFANIHHVSYFIVVQIMGGLMQSTGWAILIACLASWFGKQGRGLIMGLWSIDIGSILATLIASIWATPNGAWGWSFVVPGLIMAGLGAAAFIFLVPDPADLGLVVGQVIDPPATHGDAPATTLQAQQTKMTKIKNIFMGIPRALLIPGVIEYSLVFFFVKLVNYTFKFWLPYYIANNAVGGVLLTGQVAGWLSTLFDVGGIVGIVGLGFLSDLAGSRAAPIAIVQFITIPVLYIYRVYGGVSYASQVTLLMVNGVMVQSTYGIISAAVTSDLGTHPTLKKDENFKATVTGIINGTGAIGAAIGPLLAGWITNDYGWDKTFYVLMGANFLAGVFLSRLAIKDVKKWFEAIRDRLKTYQYRVLPSATEFHVQVPEGRVSGEEGGSETEKQGSGTKDTIL
ncbi:hypothetical protein EMCRGX_G011675 [Ephydatia muelleri]